MDTKQILTWLIVAVGLTLGLWSALWIWRHPSPADIMLGTWTDPKGPPGNFIRFEMVLMQGSQQMGVYEGRVTIHQLFGHQDATASWIGESSDPPRLNVTFPDKNRFAQLLTAPGGVYLRLVEKYGDPEQGLDPKAPGTVWLVRQQ